MTFLDAKSVWKLFPHFGVVSEPDALAGGFCFRMVVGVRVEPYALSSVVPYRSQGPIQQMRSQTTALSIRDQARVFELYLLVPIPSNSHNPTGRPSCRKL